MIIKYVGKQELLESEYICRCVRPGESYTIKDDAGRDLLKSKLWCRVDLPEGRKSKNELKKQVKEKRNG